MPALDEIINALKNDELKKFEELISQLSSSEINFQFDPSQITLLHEATCYRSEYVSLLLQNGADPYIKDRQGKTPVDWAHARKNVQAITLLEKYISTKPNDKTVLQTGDSHTDNASILEKIKLDKQIDLNLLKRVIVEIDKALLSNQVTNELLSNFSTISLLVANLHFNDNNKGKEEYVRNKYGSIDRSNNARRRAKGLEIAHLTALGKIIEHAKKPVNTVLKTNLANILNALKTIQEKINFIIEIEENNPKKTQHEIEIQLANSPETTSFTSFVNHFYSMLILEELTFLISDNTLTQLNFKKREDRYYLGRVLSLVGELSKELRDFLNPEKESGLFSFFKKIRDRKIAHAFSVMSFEPTAENLKHYQLLVKLLTVNFAKQIEQIKMELNSALVLTQEPNQEVYYHIKNITPDLGKLTPKQKTECKKLIAAVFDGKTVEINEAIINSDVSDLSSEINKKATFSETKEETTKQSSEITINSLSKSLAIILIKLKKCHELAAKKDKKSLALLEKVNAESHTLIEAYHLAIGNRNELKLIPCNSTTSHFNETKSLKQLPSLQQVQDLIDKIKEGNVPDFIEKTPDDKSIEKIVKEDDQPSAEKLAKKPKPKPRLNETKSEKTPKEQLAQNIEKITKELDYLRHIMNHRDLTQTQKNFIAEFCLAKIGQAFKDWEENERDFLLNLAPTSFATSVDSTTKTRHKLMHSPFDRKKIPFLDRLFKQTLSMDVELSAMKKILTTKPENFNAEEETVVVSFIELGAAYVHLKNYGKAIEIYESAFKLHVREAIFIKKEFSVKEVANLALILFALATTYSEAASDTDFTHDSPLLLQNYCNLSMYHLRIYIELCKKLVEAFAEKYPDLNNIVQHNLACAYEIIGDLCVRLNLTEEAKFNYQKAIRSAASLTTAAEEKRRYLYKLCFAEFRKAMTNLNQSDLKQAEVVKNTAQIIESNFSKFPLLTACLWDIKECYEASETFSSDFSPYLYLLVLLIETMLYQQSHCMNFSYAKSLFKLIKEKSSSFFSSADLLLVKRINDLDKLISELAPVFDALEEKFKGSKNLAYLDFKKEQLRNLIIFYTEFGLDLDSLQKRLANSPNVTSLIAFRVAMGLTHANNASFAIKQYEEALTLIDNQSEQYKEEIAEFTAYVSAILGDAYHEKKEHEKALGSYTIALKIYWEKPNSKAIDIVFHLLDVYKKLYPANYASRIEIVAKLTKESFSKKKPDDPTVAILDSILLSVALEKKNSTLQSDVRKTGLSPNMVKNSIRQIIWQPAPPPQDAKDSLPKTLGNGK
ncbi:ankyrin repeat domain-containing protein [Legionella clemsonensis]|uniref:Tetratricopeptide repeat protein n=1 Tax=Legionella clemsonensis TaxID=1867846 RepID=A0A222P1G5_9GAMM|nr:ankyrin repeat domain-containing protein [Legionella clemsonensis]ASQ45615.1 Tetratricopeptide repeat protein [Legionella clemsonensis]